MGEWVGVQGIVGEVTLKGRFMEPGMKWPVEVKGVGIEGCLLK